MKIKVQGMHCEACKALIRMELEENGFENKIKSINVEPENEGSIELTGVSEEEIQKAESVINSMESYKTL